jgi:ABC-type lipoprotein release transport system permease subunit
MELNKKGMIFTLMVIALLTFFTIFYSTYTIIQDRSPINKRIKNSEKS